MITTLVRDVAPCYSTKGKNILHSCSWWQWRQASCNNREDDHNMEHDMTRKPQVLYRCFLLYVSKKKDNIKQWHNWPSLSGWGHCSATGLRWSSTVINFFSWSILESSGIHQCRRLPCNKWVLKHRNRRQTNPNFIKCFFHIFKFHWKIISTKVCKSSAYYVPGKMCQLLTYTGLG